MAAGILRKRFRLAHNSSGANLVSGVASTLLDASDAELGLFEVDEGALPEIVARVRPKAVCLGNLFRDQLDRYGELEHVAARWREAVRGLPAETALVVNGDDPQLGALARVRSGALVFGVDDPALARPSLQHAADSKYCVQCGTPYEYAAAYMGHLGEYECPACGDRRPPLDVAAREIELDGLESVSFTLATPAGERRVRLRLPGLYNVYNALAAASLGLSLGASLEEIVSGLESFSAAFGRFERIAVGDRSLLMLLIKNPAGANEAVRTIVDGGTPSVVVIGLNDAIADGRDVSWIWDVDFEPLLAGLDRLVATGDRAAELALRFKYGGLDPDRIDVIPSLEAGLDRGLELTPAGGELVVLPTYTAMLALRKIVERTRLRAPVLGAGRVKIVVGHLYPDYLNIYADRGNIAVLSRRAAWRGHDLEVRAVSVGDPLRPDEHDLLYVGGGQDREQALVAQDLAAKAEDVRRAVDGGAAVLAVCGGYQLLGRSYRDFHGTELPGHRIVPARHGRGGTTHDRRRPARVRARARASDGRLPASRTTSDEPGSIQARIHSGVSSPASATTARAASKAVVWAGSSGPTSTVHSCRGTPGSPTGCSAQALAHRLGEPPELTPLPDELETEAHEVSARRAESRGGRR